MAQLLRVKRKVGESSLPALAPVKRHRRNSPDSHQQQQQEGNGSEAPVSVFQYIGTMTSHCTQLPQHVLSTVDRATARCAAEAAPAAEAGGEGVSAAGGGADVSVKHRLAHRLPHSSGATTTLLQRRLRRESARAERRFRMVSARRDAASTLVAGRRVTLLDATETTASAPATNDRVAESSESSITCNGRRLTPLKVSPALDSADSADADGAAAAAAAADYVYDLYLCTEPVAWPAGDDLDEQLELAVYGDDPTLWQACRSRSDSEHNSSDSNCESHYANDYPDDDDGEDDRYSAESDYLHECDSDGALETDLVRQLNADCRLSPHGRSDEWLTDDDQQQEEEACDEQWRGPSVGHYGSGGYESFKRRVVRDLARGADHCVSSADSSSDNEVIDLSLE